MANPFASLRRRWAERDRAAVHFYIQAVTLVSINFCQGVMLTTPFTLSVYMVRRFEAERLPPGQAVDEQRVGRLTGLLAGAFSMASFVTSIAWGIISNIIGRKAVLIIGLVVSIISMIWYGLATTYAWAVVARAFGGFFNGVLGAWKCLIGESGDSLVQGKLFGYMSVAWGLGTTIGPLIGGSLAQPCDNKPSMSLCEPGELFYERPFFLACLVGSLTIIASTLAVCLLLDETLPQSTKQRTLRVWGGRMARLRRCMGCGGSTAAGAAPTDTHTLLPTQLPQSDDTHTPRANKQAQKLPNGDCGKADAAGTACDAQESEGVLLLKAGVESSDVGAQAQAPYPHTHSHLGVELTTLPSVLTEEHRQGEGVLSVASTSSGGSQGEGGAVPVVIDTCQSVTTGTHATDGAHGTSGADGPSGIQQRGQALSSGTQRRGESDSGSSGLTLAGDSQSGQPGRSDDTQHIQPASNADGPSHSTQTQQSTQPDHSIQPDASTQSGCPYQNYRSPYKQGVGDLPSTSPARADASTHLSPTGHHSLPPPTHAHQYRVVYIDSEGREISPQNSEPGFDGRFGGTGAEWQDVELGRTPNKARKGISVDTTSPPRRVGFREGGDSQLGAQSLAPWEVAEDTPRSPGGGADSPRRPASASLRALSSLRGDSIRVRMNAFMRMGSRVFFAAPLAPFASQRSMRRDNQEARSLLGRHAETSSAPAHAASSAVQTPSKATPQAESQQGQGAADGSSKHVSGVCVEGSVEDRSAGERVSPHGVVVWYKNIQVILTITMYGFCAFLWCAVDELIPIFGAAPVETGGLGLAPSQLAPPITVFGITLMVYSALIYPTNQRIVGTLRLSRMGLATAVLVCFLLPLAHTALNKGGMVLANAVLFGTMVIKSIAQCASFTGALVMVNAAPHKSQLGEVNGVGQTVAAAVRGAGPALGGLLWAACLALHAPGQQFLPFAVVACLAIAGWVTAGYIVLPNLH